jgi:hypothetical protein
MFGVRIDDYVETCLDCFLQIHIIHFGISLDSRHNIPKAYVFLIKGEVPNRTVLSAIALTNPPLAIETAALLTRFI